MMRKMRLWTNEETDMARQLVVSDATNQECIEAINRTRHACRARLRYVDNEDVRLKMSSRGKHRSPNKSKSKGINHVAEGMRGVPDEVVADAQHRACVPRTLTAWVFGDPPPGHSALDKRGASI